MKVDSPAIWGLRSIAPPIKAGVWSGCVSARTADVKEWIHICNSCWFGLPTPVWSLALIGNASGADCRGGGISARGVFDKETRRKPLAFAADAVRYGISTAAWI